MTVPVKYMCQYFKAQGYVPTWRISIVCLALELVGSWVELGFSVGMEDFG